ncbi:MAG: transglutaminase-like domain-containing protein [Thermodesulfobacteriota bacterium]
MLHRPGALFLAVLTLFILISGSRSNADSFDENLFSIYSQGRKIGYTYDSEKYSGEITEVTEKTGLKVKLLDNVEDLATEAHYRLRGYNLLSFDFKYISPSGNVTATGVREGKSLKIKINSISGQSEMVIPAGKNLIPDSLLPGWLSSKSPEPGKEYNVPVLDPISVIAGSGGAVPYSENRIAARERVDLPYLGSFDAWRVESEITGVRITSWITDDGKLIKQTTPPGMTALLEKNGSDPDKGITEFDITESTSIHTDKELKDAREIKHMKVEIEGLDSDDGFELSDGYRQSSQGNIVEINAGDITRVKSYKIPNRDPLLAPYLKPYNSIQSDDKEIISKSREILAGENDSIKAAEKLNKWVYTNLKKTGTASIPNARDVLKTRSGDCNEHSALFAALARAAGIPTKIVSGTIYLDGRFYYHAWNEVYVGEWIAVDPTFGQVPADATHIKLVSGDLTKSSVIINAAGKINLKILEAS